VTTAYSPWRPDCDVENLSSCEETTYKIAEPLRGHLKRESVIDVAVVDDNAVFRSTLERLLTVSGQFRCVCTCSSTDDALRLIPKHDPDVVLMDIELPDFSGIECTARLKRQFPELQILILTVYKDSEQIFKALEAGASGYLLKRSTSVEILEAIRTVKAGGAPMSPEVARKVVLSFRKQDSLDRDLQTLTTREREIIDLLAQGCVSKEISAALHISYDTVCGHLANIYRKLHVRSRTEAVIKYYRETASNPASHFSRV